MNNKVSKFSLVWYKDTLYIFVLSAYIHTHTLKWIGLQVNLLSDLFFFYTCFWHLVFRKLMADLNIPFGFYSGNCFDRVKVLFNSLISLLISSWSPWQILVSSFFACILCVCVGVCVCVYMCVYTFMGFFFFFLGWGLLPFI